MPSWVLPAVAAELWGVSVDHVLAEVSAGRVRSRQEREFTFVDIDPKSAGVDPAAAAAAAEEPAEARRLAYRRSLAWAMVAPSTPIVTAAERDALLREPVMDAADPDEDAPVGDAPAPTALTEDDVPDWTAVRARVAQTRRPPGAMRSAA